METLRELDIVRALPARSGGASLRAADGDGDGGAGGIGRLTVRFSPFDVWYEVDSWWEGNFLERTVKGAFTKTMKESRDSIKVLYDHGFDFSIGNKVLAAIDDLREDDDAAVLEGDLFDTQYNRELEPGLRAGEYGSSFRFRVIKEEWDDEPDTSDHNPKGIPERTITEVRLFEAGPVTFPANPAATASLRAAASATDAYYQRLKARDPSCDGMLERARALRIPVAAGEATARDPRAATGRTGEPLSHSSGYSPSRRRELLYELSECSGGGAR